MAARAISLMLLLSACALPVLQGAPAPQPAAIADRRVAECALLAAAQAETVARGARAWPDVLVGCPGQEGLRDAMPLAAQSAALRAANQAALPAGVDSPRAAVVYRRMITRGVPEAVARDMAATQVFAAAVR